MCRIMEQVVRLAVRLGSFGFILSSGQYEIIDGLGIDREESHGGSVFGAHIRYGGPVWQFQRSETRTKVFHECSDNPQFPQLLGEGEHQVRGGTHRIHRSGEADSDHPGDRHEIRLSEHYGFGFDASDTPTHDPKTVDHGRMAICSDQGIGKQDTLLGTHTLRKVLEVHLVADSRVWRHDTEIGKTLLGPLEQTVALVVPPIFHSHIESEGILCAEAVDLDGMVNNQVDRDLRVDVFRVFSCLCNSIAQGRQVNYGRNTGEVLHKDPGRIKRYLGGSFQLTRAVDHRFERVFVDKSGVHVPHEVL